MTVRHKILAVWRDGREDVCEYNIDNIVMAHHLHSKGDIVELEILSEFDIDAKIDKTEWEQEKPIVEFGYKTDLNLDRIERDAILAALNLTDWNQKKSAKLLGISARSLHYKIHNVHEIDFDFNKK